MSGAKDTATSTLLARISDAARSTGAPLLVHVVANGVRGDSRVIKAANTSSDQGFASMILGIAQGEAPEVLELDGVVAVLVPFHPMADRTAVLRRWDELSKAVAPFRTLRNLTGLARRRRPPRRPAGSGRAVPSWAAQRPANLNISVAFAEALGALGPDVIHAHDVVPLPGVVSHVAQSRIRGRRTRALYDSHECVPRLAKSYPSHAAFQAMLAIEQEYIHDVDSVIAVSGQIGSVLKRTYGLSAKPGVVTNAPHAGRDQAAPSLREAIGLDPAAALAVYSGSIDPERGLDTAVRALAALPELHLAIVCNSYRPALGAVTRLARQLGVTDRVHLAPYVAPSQVTQYLSSATLGIIPRKPGGHLDLSLPTKYREFLHAGLPIVASDNKAMARELTATGVGEVVRADSVSHLVAGLTRVLADPEGYRSRITPEILTEHSWEKQERVLRRKYLALSARPPRNDGRVDLSAALTDLTDLKEQPAGTAPGRVKRPTRTELVGVSLGIGRANYAGQAFYWAEAAANNLGVASESFGHKTALTHPPHRTLPVLRVDQPTALEELRRIVTSYTHVLIDGFLPVSGPLLGDDVEPDIAVLRRHGLAVGLIAHGSDVRDPDAHMERFPDSYFHTAPAEWTDRIRRISARNREIVAGFDGPVFVSTPGSLVDLPEATWLPIVIDVERWTGLAPILPGPRPRVLHQPSRSVPPIKGSEVIVPVLEELDRQGAISHVATPGRVMADQMPALIEQADIVVDHVRGASYGAAAIEAMAAGRVVVAGLSPLVRATVGDPLPIVHATPDTLAAVITELAASPDTMRRLADEGREFAAKWHSGAASARVVEAFLTS